MHLETDRRRETTQCLHGSPSPPGATQNPGRAARRHGDIPSPRTADVAAKRGPPPRKGCRRFCSRRIAGTPEVILQAEARPLSSPSLLGGFISTDGPPCRLGRRQLSDRSCRICVRPVWVHPADFKRETRSRFLETECLATLKLSANIPGCLSAESLSDKRGSGSRAHRAFSIHRVVRLRQVA